MLLQTLSITDIALASFFVSFRSYPNKSGWFMVFMPYLTIFQLYSLWRSVLLVKETGVPGENHRPKYPMKAVTYFFNFEMKTMYFSW